MVTHGNGIKVNISKSIWDLGAVNRASHSPALLAWKIENKYVPRQQIPFETTEICVFLFTLFLHAGLHFNIFSFPVRLFIILQWILYCKCSSLPGFTVISDQWNTSNICCIESLFGGAFFKIKGPFLKLHHSHLMHKDSRMSRNISHLFNLAAPHFCVCQYIHSVSTFEVLWLVWFQDAPPSSLQEVTDKFQKRPCLCFSIIGDGLFCDRCGN